MSASELKYRLLPADEWPKIAGVFSSMRKKMPDPRFAKVIVAERGDRIVGFLFIQLAAHMEPLWIKREERGRVNWRRMVRELEKVLKEGTYYVHAPQGSVQKMCEIVGMRPNFDLLFEKEL